MSSSPFRICRTSRRATPGWGEAHQEADKLGLAGRPSLADLESTFDSAGFTGQLNFQHGLARYRINTDEFASARIEPVTVRRGG